MAALTSLVRRCTHGSASTHGVVLGNRADRAPALGDPVAAAVAGRDRVRAGAGRDPGHGGTVGACPRDPERTPVHLPGRRAAGGAPKPGGAAPAGPAGGGARPRPARPRCHRARPRGGAARPARRGRGARPADDRHRPPAERRVAALVRRTGGGAAGIRRAPRAQRGAVGDGRTAARAGARSWSPTSITTASTSWCIST